MEPLIVERSRDTIGYQIRKECQTGPPIERAFAIKNKDNYYMFNLLQFNTFGIPYIEPLKELHEKIATPTRAKQLLKDIVINDAYRMAYTMKTVVIDKTI